MEGRYGDGMNKLLGVVALALSALTLVACGNLQGPPSRPVTVELREVSPLAVSGNELRTSEIVIRVRITNTTGEPMWLLSSDFSYKPSSHLPGRVATVWSPIGNSSTCSSGPVNEGRTISCSLIFYWDTYHPQELIVPGRLRWRDSSGYSHPNANGSLEISDWVDR